MQSHSKKLGRLILVASLVFLFLLSSIGFVLWSESKVINDQIAKLDKLQQSLNRIKISRPGYNDVLLELKDSGWMIQEPCVVAANPQRIQPLSQLLQAAAHHYDAVDVDLQAAGLENPLAQITLNTTDIFIGDTDLSGERRYIQRGDKIEFIPEWVLSLIQGGVSGLAELRVFSESLISISLSLRNSTPIVNSAQDSKTWQSLSANQVVQWPLTNSEPTLEQAYLIHYETAAGKAEMSLLKYAEFSAIVPAETSCAFILDNNILPVLPDK